MKMRNCGGKWRSGRVEPNYKTKGAPKKSVEQGVHKGTQKKVAGATQEEKGRETNANEVNENEPTYI
jgi:hypothetical protein